MKKLLLLIILIFGTNIQNSLAKSDFIVAKINNRAITNSELFDRYKLVLYISKIKIKSKIDKKLLLNQVLDKMIDEELIRQEGENLKISVTSAEVQETADNISYRQRKKPSQLKREIKKRGISFDNYLKQIESELLWSKIISRTIRPRTKVGEVEIKEFFEQRKLDTSKKKFLLAEIFIPKSSNAKKLAEKLVLELKNGANFENIVRQFSRSLSVENDGKIGWFFGTDLDPKINKEILNLEKGGYSNPVITNNGYQIFKIIDLAINEEIPEREMKMAKDIIFAKKLEILAKGALMDLKKKSYVEVSL